LKHFLLQDDGVLFPTCAPKNFFIHHSSHCTLF